MSLCKECGDVHANPNEHIYTYVDSQELLNKRGLVDSLTLEPFIDPVELPCRHTFTRTSIESALSNKKECPECRKKTSKINETSRIVREQVNQLEVVCPNRCGMNVERQLLPNHLVEKCENRKICCPNKYKEESCKFYGVKNDLETHKNECVFRILDCEGKCGAFAREHVHPLPIHNCIHFISQKSKLMRNLLNQIVPELNTIITITNETKIKFTNIENKLFEQNAKILGQDSKILEQDTKILNLEKKELIQDKKLTELNSLVQILSKEYHENKLKILKENAEKGDAISQIQIGKLYQYGNEYIPKNGWSAHFWYDKAKEQDSKMALECIKSLETNTWVQKRPLVETEIGEAYEKDDSHSSKKQKLDYGAVFGKSTLGDRKIINTTVTNAETSNAFCKPN